MIHKITKTSLLSALNPAGLVSVANHVLPHPGAFVRLDGELFVVVEDPGCPRKWRVATKIARGLPTTDPKDTYVQFQVEPLIQRIHFGFPLCHSFDLVFDTAGAVSLRDNADTTSLYIGTTKHGNPFNLRHKLVDVFKVEDLMRRIRFVIDGAESVYPTVLMAGHKACSVLFINPRPDHVLVSWIPGWLHAHLGPDDAEEVEAVKIDARLFYRILLYSVNNLKKAGFVLSLDNTNDKRYIRCLIGRVAFEILECDILPDERYDFASVVTEVLESRNLFRPVDAHRVPDFVRERINSNGDFCIEHNGRVYRVSNGCYIVHASVGTP